MFTENSLDFGLDIPTPDTYTYHYPEHVPRGSYFTPHRTWPKSLESRVKQKIKALIYIVAARSQSSI